MRIRALLIPLAGLVWASFLFFGSPDITFYDGTTSQKVGLDCRPLGRSGGTWILDTPLTSAQLEWFHGYLSRAGDTKSPETVASLRTEVPQALHAQCADARQNRAVLLLLVAFGTGLGFLRWKRVVVPDPAPAGVTPPSS